MKIKSITIVLITLVSSGCDRIKLEPTQLYVRGQLLLTDTITQNKIAVPLPGKTVRLTDKATPASSDQFWYSTTTDAEGYFVFQLLELKDSVQLRYNESINEVKYSARKIVKQAEPNVNLEVYLDELKQNGFVVGELLEKSKLT